MGSSFVHPLAFSCLSLQSLLCVGLKQKLHTAYLATLVSGHGHYL